jgi:Holliday junction resolvasome RuvABC endonuclease subunit
MPFPIILAVDPSMNSLGWAAHNLNLGENRYDINSDAWRFGLIRPRSRSEHCQYRWENAASRLREALDDWEPTHMALEYPTFFDSTAGKIAAMQGYTLDLAGMVGYIMGRFKMPPDAVTLWKPEQWKGTVPKHITQAKFVRLYGDSASYIVKNYPDDVSDAIMIADFWLTLYHREKFFWQQRAKARI